jgi:hypothetical protein
MKKSLITATVIATPVYTTALAQAFNKAAKS